MIFQGAICGHFSCKILSKETEELTEPTEEKYAVRAPAGCLGLTMRVWSCSHRMLRVVSVVSAESVGTEERHNTILETGRPRHTREIVRHTHTL